jgi:transposase
MPRRTGLDLPREAQAQLLAALRRARYGDLRALHLMLLCAAGRSPTEIAGVLFCSRSSVYRTIRGDDERTLGVGHDDDGQLAPPVRTPVLCPTRRRSLPALRKATPQACGWCRTRWSGATLALPLQARRGLTVSAETTRRWLHERGWGWKRAKLGAEDDEPQRVKRLARIRWGFEPRKRGEAMAFADELEIHLLPTVGWAWTPNRTQPAVMTPGQHQQHDRAGALDLATGTLLHCLGTRTTNARFRGLRARLEASYAAERYTRLSGVVDNDKIHNAKAVEQWLASRPRVTRLLVPTSCPRATPMERAFGAVHDCCTRTHRRNRLPHLGADVEEHLQVNGPWLYKLSEIYDEPAVTAAVEAIAAAAQATGAACVYQAYLA